MKGRKEEVTLTDTWPMSNPFIYSVFYPSSHFSEPFSAPAPEHTQSSWLTR